MFGLDDLAAAGIQWWLGSHSQRRQYGYQKDFFRHQHQWEVEDLRRAGLNPILSATHGPIGGGNVSPIVSPDVSSAVREYKLQQQRIDEVEKRKLDLETNRVMSEVVLNSARASTEAAQQKNLASQADLNSAHAVNVRYQREALMPAQVREVEAHIQERGAITLREFKQAAWLVAQTLYSHSASDLNRVKTQLDRLSLPKAEATGLLRKEHGAALSWTDELTGWVRNLAVGLYWQHVMSRKAPSMVESMGGR